MPQCSRDNMKTKQCPFRLTTATGAETAFVQNPVMQSPLMLNYLSIIVITTPALGTVSTYVILSQLCCEQNACH